MVNTSCLKIFNLFCFKTKISNRFTPFEFFLNMQNKITKKITGKIKSSQEQMQESCFLKQKGKHRYLGNEMKRIISKKEIKNEM